MPNSMNAAPDGCMLYTVHVWKCLNLNSISSRMCETSPSRITMYFLSVFCYVFCRARRSSSRPKRCLNPQYWAPWNETAVLDENAQAVVPRATVWHISLWRPVHFEQFIKGMCEETCKLHRETTWFPFPMFLWVDKLVWKVSIGSANAPSRGHGHGEDAHNLTPISAPWLVQPPEDAHNLRPSSAPWLGATTMSCTRSTNSGHCYATLRFFVSADRIPESVEISRNERQHPAQPADSTTSAKSMLLTLQHRKSQFRSRDCVSKFNLIVNDPMWPAADELESQEWMRRLLSLSKRIDETDGSQLLGKCKQGCFLCPESWIEEMSLSDCHAQTDRGWNNQFIQICKYMHDTCIYPLLWEINNSNVITWKCIPSPVPFMSRKIKELEFSADGQLLILMTKDSRLQCHVRQFAIPSAFPYDHSTLQRRV